MKCEPHVHFRPVKVIDSYDWDKIVSEVYGRIYCFQQQDGCKDRGVESFQVPVTYPEDYENDSVPEIVNHDEMGVSFAAWLARDPNQKLSDRENSCSIDLPLWWSRNFYPSLDMIINDLHAKGILDEGSYMIKIDW